MKIKTLAQVKAKMMQREDFRAAYKAEENKEQRPVGNKTQQGQLGEKRTIKPLKIG